MGRPKGFKMSQEQKDKISLKMKRIANASECPECGRRNAMVMYPGDIGMISVCRWCHTPATWEKAGQ